MKFKFLHGLIWIPIELVYEGKRSTINDCILDTGSATTAIDIEFGDLSSDFGINGFIGNDILSKFTVIIDFLTQELKMTFYKNPDRHSHPCQG